MGVSPKPICSMIEKTKKKLGTPDEKMVVTIMPRGGNCHW